MAKTIKPPADYLISSSLLPDTDQQYVYSSFLIDIPKGEDIALVSINPAEGTIETPGGEEVPCIFTTITYKAYKANFPYRPGERYDHPRLFGYPHQVKIVVTSIAGGSNSIVTDQVY